MKTAHKASRNHRVHQGIYEQPHLFAFPSELELNQLHMRKVHCAKFVLEGIRGLGIDRDHAERWEEALQPSQWNEETVTAAGFRKSASAGIAVMLTILEGSTMLKILQDEYDCMEEGEQVFKQMTGRRMQRGPIGTDKTQQREYIMKMFYTCVPAATINLLDLKNNAQMTATADVLEFLRDGGLMPSDKKQGMALSTAAEFLRDRYKVQTVKLLPRELILSGILERQGTSLVDLQIIEAGTQCRHAIALLKLSCLQSEQAQAELGGEGIHIAEVREGDADPRFLLESDMGTPAKVATFFTGNPDALITFMEVWWIGDPGVCVCACARERERERESLAQRVR
jgi:hypothetical protein